MNKQTLMELGLTEELADKVLAGLDGAYVPKERFNQVNERMKAAEKLAQETKNQLDADGARQRLPRASQPRCRQRFPTGNPLQKRAGLLC